jgi:hypothetical protein
MRLLPWSKTLCLPLGSLGFPIRKVAIRKRSRYTDRYQSRFNWKTQVDCFRFVNLSH